MARLGQVAWLASLLVGGVVGARTNLDIESSSRELSNAHAAEEALLSSAEEAEEFILDARKQGVAGPPFDPSVLGDSFDVLKKQSVTACGARITTTAEMEWSSMETIASNPSLYFKKRQYGDREQILTIGEMVGTIAREWKGSLMDGREPVQVGRIKGPFADVKHFLKTLQAELEVVGKDGNMPRFVPVKFDLGLDLRSCWGDLQDQSGRGVCNDDVLSDLAVDVRKVEPKMDKAGQSGSTIITNLRGFIVKNVADGAERSIIKKVLPDFSGNIANRSFREGKCHSTGVTPLCAVLAGPGGVEWLVMRKVEIPGGKKIAHELDGNLVKFQDLKGPEFLKGVRDLKTYTGKSHVWKVKDPGFARLFPDGLQLRGCGSRDAAQALGLDSALLLKNEMTDYSFFMKYYEAPAEEEYKCQCDGAAAPKFPIILDVVSPGKGQRPMRIAIGIIDYVETEVRGGVKSLFSTMKSPEVYSNWFMKMWPAYFHIPERKLRLEGKGSAILEAFDHQPAEHIFIGQRVSALETIRWHGEGWFSGDLEKEVYASNRVWSAFLGLAGEDTPLNCEDADYNIFIGDKGVIRNVASAVKGEALMVAVEWDKFPGKLYYTKPHLIVPVPRELLPQ